MLALALLWGACASPAPPAPPVDAHPTIPSPSDAEQVDRAPVRLPGGDAQVPVALAFQGVGHLHQGFFSTDEIVSTLSTGLGGCVGGTAEVVVAYDSERRVGTVLLHTVGPQLNCRPEIVGDGFNLSPAVPAAQALAAYRDAVSNQFALRVASFRVGIRVLRGSSVCDLWLGGQYPPDGSSFAPCVHAQGRKVCAAPAPEGLTQLRLDDAEATAALRRCYSP